MKEKILKKLSRMNVKMLRLEKLVKFFAETEGEISEDSSKVIAYTEAVKSQKEQYKKQLQEVNFSKK